MLRAKWFITFRTTLNARGMQNAKVYIDCLRVCSSITAGFCWIYLEEVCTRVWILNRNMRPFKFRMDFVFAWECWIETNVSNTMGNTSEYKICHASEAEAEVYVLDYLKYNIHTNKYIVREVCLQSLANLQRHMQRKHTQLCTGQLIALRRTGFGCFFGLDGRRITAIRYV